MSIFIDLRNVRPLPGFLTLLNDRVKGNYTLSDITVGELSLLDNDPSRVSAAVTFHNGSLVGNRTVHWRRLHIGNYSEDTPVVLIKSDVADANYTSSQQLASHISSATGIEIHPDDIVDENLNPGEWTYPHQLYIQVKPDNLAWYGSLSITVNGQITPPSPRFYIGVNGVSTTTTDLVSFASTTGTIIPEADTQGNYVTVGGENDDIYYFNIDGRFCFSNDGGQSFIFEKTFEDFSLSVQQMVFFKGKLYALCALPWPNASQTRVFELTIVRTAGEVTDVTGTEVLNTTLGGNYPFHMFNNHNHLVLLTGDDYKYYYTTDGLVWIPMTMTHPWANDGSPEYEAVGGCFVGNQMVLSGWAWDITEVGKYWKRPVFAVGEVGGTLTYKQTLNPVQYNSNNWALEKQLVLGAIDNTVYLMVRLAYDDNSTDAFPDSFGDLFKSTDLGDTWEMVHYNTGIEWVRWIDNGDIAMFAGWCHKSPGRTNYLAYTLDRGATWLLEDDVTSPLYDAPFEGLFIASRNYLPTQT